MAWNNSDGLQVLFPADRRAKTANYARKGKTYGATEELVYEFDLSKIAAGATSYPDDLNNDGTKDGFHEGRVALPANSRVTKVTLVMSQAAAGGTSITFGTFQQAGTAIDADGLITATEGVIANMNAVGKSINGAGAQVALSSNAGASIGTVKAFLALVATGTFTAGKGRIVVEYQTAVLP